MTSPESAADRPDAFPTPREGLDNGSLSELRIDAGEVPLDVPPPHPMGGAHHDIDVPGGIRSWNGSGSTSPFSARHGPWRTMNRSHT